MGGEAKHESFLNKRMLGAMAIVCGSVALNACKALEEPLIESSEGVQRREVVVCFAEKPNCTSADVESGMALAVLGSGNAIDIEEIPEVCSENRLVEANYEKDVPPWLLYAYIAVEDRRFCEHDGVDMWALARAAVHTFIGDRQGGSSTEAQLARNLYLDARPEDDLTRKAWEYLVAAPSINEQYTKTEILQKYFNIVYFGRDAFGIEAAAEIYFGIKASELSVDQSAALIALLQNPGKYEGSENAELDEEARIAHYLERNEVLSSMQKAGFLKSEDAEMFKSQPLGTRAYRKFDTQNNFAGANSVQAQFITNLILSDVHSNLPEGASIYDVRHINTTISRTDQASAAKAYLEHSAGLTQDGRQFGVVLVDETGAITAYIPGVFAYDGLNIDLLRAHILGGSQDKPYFLASALLVDTISPETIVPDPMSYTWTNYDGNGTNYVISEGARCPEVTSCSLRDSIAYSANGGILSLIHNLEQNGVPALRNGFNIMDAFGMDRAKPVGPAAILGGGEITPLMRALGTMQLNGLQGRAIPQQNRGRVINSIVLDSGETIQLYDENALYQQVVPAEVAAAVTDILGSAVEYGTAKRLSAVAQRTHVIAKTGTPENNVAPGVNGVFCAYDGRNRGFAVILRQPRSSASLGSDADGGKAPTALAADVIAGLTGEYCRIN